MTIVNRSLFAAAAVLLFIIIFAVYAGTNQNDLRSKTGRWGPYFRPKQNRKKEIKVGIQLTENQGYTEFTASVIKNFHEIDGCDIDLYSRSTTGQNHNQVSQWYGASITITRLGFLKTILQQFVSQSSYESLFIIDSNMVFLPSWKDFIIKHMINSSKPVQFLSLYHAANMHSFTNDCENLAESDLCEGPLQAKFGVALSKHFAEKILLNHLDLLEQYNWDEILRKENLPSLYPRKSLIINIKQTHQTEDYCGENAVPYGFNSCKLPDWIRDGLEWYMDRCTNAQEKYLPGISLGQANRESRPWTRPAISYSLFGSRTRYTDGALANSRRVYSIYPGWKIWIYLDNSVPKNVVERLCEQNVKFVNMTGASVINKMSWRFLIASEPVRMYAIRDIDSKLLPRGKTAVDEWIKSGRKFHVMRDHRNHANYAMNGGMWGGRVAIPDMRSMLKRYRGGNAYMTDMNFLGSVVWKIVKKSVWAHDSHSLHKFGEDHQFATPWNASEFVGRVEFS